MQRLPASGPYGATLAPLIEAKKIIARHFPPVIADLYADPQSNSDAIEWLSAREGLPIPFSELEKPAQEKLLKRFYQHQLAIKHLADELERKGAHADAATIRKTLAPPDTNHLFAIGSEPVMTHWQFQAVQPAAPITDSQPIVPESVEQAKVTEPVLQAPTQNTARIQSAGRRFPWWWLLLLALVLALALLYWFWWLPRNPALPLASNECIAKPTAPEHSDFVVIFDTSGSMQINVNATPEDEAWLASVWETNPIRRFMMSEADKNAEDARKTALLQEPTRMTVSKSALTDIIKKIPPQIPIGLVTYSQCNTPQNTHGYFNHAARPALTRAIQNLVPEGSTPLAASMQAAASMVDGVNKDAQIVIFVDGTDGCEANQCTVAQQIKEAKPKLRFHVLDLTGSGQSNCIAEKTGGRVYNPKNSIQITTMLTQAVGEITGDAYCK